MRISLFTDVYRLAVSKSPAVYTLSPALDGLWRENRGSVNRLYENKSNHFHVKGFALTLACSRLRDSLVRGDLESGRGRVFPTIWEPGAGYTHPRFEREDSGHSEIFERKQVHTKRSKRRFITHIIEGSIKNCTSRDVKKTPIYAGAQVPLRASKLIKWRTQTEERFTWKAVHLYCVTTKKT